METATGKDNCKDSGNNGNSGNGNGNGSGDGDTDMMGAMLRNILRKIADINQHLQRLYELIRDVNLCIPVAAGQGNGEHVHIFQMSLIVLHNMRDQYKQQLDSAMMELRCATRLTQRVRGDQ